MTTDVLTPRATAALPRFGRGAPDSESEFYTTVKARVDSWFAERGVRRQGDHRMVIKVLFWVPMVVGSWSVLVFSGLSAPASVPVWMLLGLSMAFMAVNLGHDAFHASAFPSDRANRLLSWTYDVIGANARNWLIAHNVLHHTYTNVPRVDPDIDTGPKLRLHPHAPRYFFHRFQHVYAWGLYALLTVSWVTISDASLAAQVHPSTGKRPTIADWGRFAVGKLCHFGFALVVPLCLLDQQWWQVILGFLLMHAATGLVLATTFQLAHVVEGPEMVPADAAGDLANRWAVHQLRTTSNFRPGSRWLTFLAGGLNHQVEHHLFPRICHVHYPDIAPIIAATAAEYGLPYHSYPTVRSALLGHFRRLRELGRPVHG